MDPFTVCLIFSALIVKLIKVDAQYAKQGKEPPGYGLIGKWLDGRKARGQAPADAKPAKYGMWRYFWQRWRAMWEVLAEGHKVKHEQYLKDRKQALLDGTPKPKRPGLKEQIAEAWKWVAEAIVKPVGDSKKTSPEAVNQPAEPAPEVPATPEQTSDGPVITCDDCGAALIDASGGWKHPHDSTCPQASPQPDPNPAPQGAAAKTPRKSQTAAAAPNKGENMPVAQVSGEVTGIPSAVGYLNQMATIHRSHADNEALCASLAGFRVGPADIDLVRAAITASNEAADLYTHAAKILEDNNAGVRQGYASAPDAADKKAQMAE